MKYYFITYQALNKQNCVSIWNTVINQSPMRFIIDTQKIEYNGYKNFIVLNTCEITEFEYNEFKDKF